jgi:hypothetical protein
MGFAERGIEPAAGFAGDGFIVRPLVPTDVALDHDAVMASREFLYHWEQDPPYPPVDFSVDDNLVDLQKMDEAHRNGSRYTYTVMNTAESEVLGCIYLLPNDDRLYRTAEVTSHDDGVVLGSALDLGEWVRAHPAPGGARLASRRLGARTTRGHHQRAPSSPDRHDRVARTHSTIRLRPGQRHVHLPRIRQMNRPGSVGGRRPRQYPKTGAG